MEIFLRFMQFLSVKDLDFIANLAKRALGKKLSHAERNRRFWDRIAEPHILEKMAPPAVPSPGDIAIYHKYIKKTGLADSILILGSTPKIRELLQNLGVNNYIVSDFSYRMIENNLALAPRIDASKEIWLKINWNELSYKLRPVDCIVGDFILNQTPPPSQLDFLEKINAFLKPGGVFIVRDHVMNQSFAAQDPEYIVQETLKELSPKNAAVIVTTLFYRLRDKLRDNKNQLTKPDKLVQVLVDHNPTDEYERELLRKLLTEILRKSRDNLDYNAQTENELELQLTKFFRIEDKGFADDYEDARYFPIYFLKKK